MRFDVIERHWAYFSISTRALGQTTHKSRCLKRRVKHRRSMLQRTGSIFNFDKCKTFTRPYLRFFKSERFRPRTTSTNQHVGLRQPKRRAWLNNVKCVVPLVCYPSDAETQKSQSSTETPRYVSNVKQRGEISSSDMQYTASAQL